MPVATGSGAGRALDRQRSRSFDACLAFNSMDGGAAIAGTMDEAPKARPLNSNASVFDPRPSSRTFKRWDRNPCRSPDGGSPFSSKRKEMRILRHVAGDGTAVASCARREGACLHNRQGE